MNRRKLSLVLLVSALVFSTLLVPLSAGADHCRQVFIFTGHTTAVTNPSSGNPIGARTNLGAFGCTFEALGAAGVDTNILTPGASSAAVGADPIVTTLVPTGGTFTMGTQTVALVFTGCAPGARCDSAVFALTDPGADSATASVTFSNGSTDSITYQAAS